MSWTPGFSIPTPNEGGGEDQDGVTKSDVGLGNVNNTSDANKPVSTAQQAALDNKADLDGGNLDGASATAWREALSVDDFFEPAGLTGATADSRYVGATASGAPVSGTFSVGDYVVDRSGAFWICVVAGSPGTWVSPSANAELARAELASTTLSTASANNSFVDITGCSITFTVGSRPVDVIGVIPLATNSVDGQSVSLYISDNANAAKAAASVTVSGNAGAGILRAEERIVTPGTYTRKIRLRNQASGSTSNVASAFMTATSVAYISAVQR